MSKHLCRDKLYRKILHSVGILTYIHKPHCSLGLPLSIHLFENRILLLAGDTVVRAEVNDCWNTAVLSPQGRFCKASG